MRNAFIFMVVTFLTIVDVEERELYRSEYKNWKKKCSKEQWLAFIKSK